MIYWVLSLFSGHEIIGGFKGTETERKPEGSIYATILSGDGAHDDDQVTSWPPSEQDIEDHLLDNASHVIQIVFCGKGAISTKIEGITIANGFANQVTVSNSRATIARNYPSLSSTIETGIYYKSYNKPLFDYNIGGGVYISHGAPTISKCIIKNNHSYENGAGIYGRAGPENLKNCLFEENSTITSDGAGLYITNAKNTFIDGCVFDGNYTMAELPGDQMLGGALYALYSKIDIVNTIFTGNYATAAGGAVYNEESFLKLINCTVTGNDGGYPGGGIVNKETEPGFYSTKIVNTILWNNHESHTSELFGGNFDVSYSCVDGGFAGVGNIAEDPFFVDEENPEGEDGRYGGYDDGHRLKSNSSCIDKGYDGESCEYDLIGIHRPIGLNVDIGAYEHEEYLSQKQVLGRVINGNFVYNNSLDVLEDIFSEKQIYLYSRSNYSRVFQMEIPNNKYTQGKSEINIFLLPVDKNGNPISGIGEICLPLKKVSNNSASLIFRSLTEDWGKPIIFSDDPRYHFYQNEHAHILYIADGGVINYRFPESQF